MLVQDTLGLVLMLGLVVLELARLLQLVPALGRPLVGWVARFSRSESARFCLNASLLRDDGRRWCVPLLIDSGLNYRSDRGL